MRKIMSHQEREAKELRNKRLITVLLGAIMLLSSLGYAFMSFGDFGGNSGGGSGKLEYNGVTFEQNQYGYWAFSYGGNTYNTLFTPNDTVNVSISEAVSAKVSDYYGKTVYVTGDPIEEISVSGASEIDRNLANIASRFNYACYEGDENCTQNYPIKNCSSDTLIIFKRSDTNSSKISQDDGCVVITYSEGNEEIAADAFLFRIMGLV